EGERFGLVKLAFPFEEESQPVHVIGNVGVIRTQLFLAKGDGIAQQLFGLGELVLEVERRRETSSRVEQLGGIVSDQTLSRRKRLAKNLLRFGCSAFPLDEDPAQSGLLRHDSHARFAM